MCITPNVNAYVMLYELNVLHGPFFLEVLGHVHMAKTISSSLPASASAKTSLRTRERSY
jgi:hypothetical protein